MINFNYEVAFELRDENSYGQWVAYSCASEGYALGELNYIFCDDNYLLDINQRYLQHDDFTDIITFDYTQGKVIAGDIYISIDRVKENAKTYKASFENELLRVMAHGLLHLAGYKDKSAVETAQMRTKEEEKIKLFHVEQ